VTGGPVVVVVEAVGAEVEAAVCLFTVVVVEAGEVEAGEVEAGEVEAGEVEVVAPAFAGVRALMDEARHPASIMTRLAPAPTAVSALKPLRMLSTRSTLSVA
jgi:hypothetical protein